MSDSPEIAVSAMTSSASFVAEFGTVKQWGAVYRNRGMCNNRSCGKSCNNLQERWLREAVVHKPKAAYERGN
jgi:hypothetical protein